VQAAREVSTLERGQRFYQAQILTRYWVTLGGVSGFVGTIRGTFCRRFE
jgi:hypothetical protein